MKVTHCLIPGVFVLAHLQSHFGCVPWLHKRSPFTCLVGYDRPVLERIGGSNPYGQQRADQRKDSTGFRTTVVEVSERQLN